MLTETQIEQYLARRGLPCDRVGPATIASTFDGRTATFRFFIRLTADWVLFTVVPFTDRPTDPRVLFALYERLLKLNRQMNLAKFAIDEDDDVLLTVEFPTENIHDTDLDGAVDGLMVYADAHFDELRTLVRGPASQRPTTS
jgi:hypothetical protein